MFAICGLLYVAYVARNGATSYAARYTLLSLGRPVNHIVLDPATVDGSGVTLRGIVPHLKTAYVQSMNLTVQYQLTSNTSFQVAYVGTLGRHLEANAGVANVVHQLLVPSANQAPFRQYPDLAPGGSIQQDWGNMYYHSLQTNLQHQFSHGSSFLTNFTWARCRTDAVDQLNATAILSSSRAWT